ncbi:hypothetical protein [Litoreibacter janthinus]|uniref:DUF4142 domain-containing protein n=1 Tax=Litoreibacter janthinus TaxID=670154 RepID=A0A1I6GPL8_9RHOB|nr:hypothetical protein [Litoreibacter janthinus]SFR44134.1 hypothetical protein SAMN04488002_1806 [Litoreibacter janthinus]
MKTIIATAIALTISAPAFAQVSDAEAYFAMSNDSAAERIVNETSTGDVYEAQLRGALANESAAERMVESQANEATRADADLLSFFATSKDSAAERAARIE